MDEKDLNDSCNKSHLFDFKWNLAVSLVPDFMSREGGRERSSATLGLERVCVARGRSVGGQLERHPACHPDLATTEARLTEGPAGRMLAGWVTIVQYE